MAGSSSAISILGTLSRGSKMFGMFCFPPITSDVLNGVEQRVEIGFHGSGRAAAGAPLDDGVLE